MIWEIFDLDFTRNPTIGQKDSEKHLIDFRHYQLTKKGDGRVDHLFLTGIVVTEWIHLKVPDM